MFENLPHEKRSKLSSVKKLNQNGYTFEWFNFSNFIAYVLHFKIFKSKDMSSIYINLLLKCFIAFVLTIDSVGIVAFVLQKIKLLL